MENIWPFRLKHFYHFLIRFRFLFAQVPWVDDDGWDVNEEFMEYPNQYMYMWHETPEPWKTIQKSLLSGSRVKNRKWKIWNKRNDHFVNDISVQLKRKPILRIIIMLSICLMNTVQLFLTTLKIFSKCQNWGGGCSKVLLSLKYKNICRYHFWGG